jgi:predicted AAA+ superfamily ATPase
VGKTTLVKHLLKHIDIPTHYASADLPTIQDLPWLEQQWEIGRLLVRENTNTKSALIVLDEVQKIPQWSEKIKALWDADSFNDISLKVIILGSSPLLIQKGLTETLAGRFELMHMTHWSFTEMREAFDFDLNQYIYFGGYPGSAGLIKDEKRWADYINQSLIETSISRDILLMTREMLQHWRII